jgi:IS30 family transposase
MTEIGRRLGRNKPTVSRELKRNGNRDGSYHPWRATSLYKHRRKASGRKPRLDDPEVRPYVRYHLGHDFWAPKCITERLKMERPGTKLSHNTIYRVIKDGLLKKKFPAKIYLRRGGRTPNRRNTAAIKPDRTIHGSPASIENRERTGDLEGDTVYGGAGGKGGTLTLADRSSKFLYATLRGEQYHAGQRQRVRSSQGDFGAA